MAAANRQESDPDPSLCRLILIEGIPGGREGMFAFYAHYRAICDELIASSDFPLLRFDTSTGDWDGLHAALSPWLDKLAANRNITPRPWQHHT